MKYLKHQEEILESNFYNTEEEINRYCVNNNIRNYTINDDFSIDVNDNVFMANERIESFPVKFNIIHGGFYCNDNNLETFKNFPKRITGDFDCTHNNFKDLNNFPIVGGRVRLVFNPVYIVARIFMTKDNKFELLDEFNEYSIIRGDDILWNRLKIFCDDFDLEIPDIDRIKEVYTVI